MKNSSNSYRLRVKDARFLRVVLSTMKDITKKDSHNHHKYQSIINMINEFELVNVDQDSELTITLSDSDLEFIMAYFNEQNTLPEDLRNQDFHNSLNELRDNILRAKDNGKKGNDRQSKQRVVDEMRIAVAHQDAAKSPHFLADLETVILATRGGGSGAKACQEVLLSLYNGNDYKLNLSSLHNLDNDNHRAVMNVIQVLTRTNPKPINQILLQYADDFERMLTA